ncbi:uroporphyrinogen decarboxylase [Paraphotobacterium marinum]|uniref:Uroporphyrinogen decarboxylase n=1 Tax=Paraphotobacterium marinum TaxID=1755811 RepID=A0A220VD18_9GAMM|nr:uroporphyrinogen decarboxylase [Paraphotobacterium marinum]ASK78235.1 uroporphyrinogen decarboxylase [Paraphotobacterium marinum]
MKNNNYLNAIYKKPIEHTPIWIMRQAGRYLPEYREVRKKAGDSFISLMKNPDLACEVTLQPLKRFKLDAAILFSDILTIPEAMNLGLSFGKGEGPKISKPIVNKSDILNLPILDTANDLNYVYKAISLIKTKLNETVPLIGFSGSPWTIATYMVEGGGSKTFTKIKSMMYKNPKELHLLLENLTENIVDYLVNQVKTGVDAIKIFDSWGGVLGRREYNEFSLRYMIKIVEKLKSCFYDKKIPITIFTKNGGLWLEDIANSGCDMVGLDWTIDICDALDRIGDKVAVEGNMDPCVLFGTKDKIEQEVEYILKQVNGRRGFVFNLGHGIQKETPIESVSTLVNKVHHYSAGECY